MKKFYALVLLMLLPVCLFAQSKSTKPKQLCEFEKLFSLKPGMDTVRATIGAVEPIFKNYFVKSNHRKTKALCKRW